MVAGVTVLSIAVPKLMPWSFLALAGLAAFACWAARWEITVWAWLWVLSHGLIEWPEWRIHIPGFFAMTAPRLVFVAASVAFGLHFMLRNQRVRLDRGLLWAMLALSVYVGMNAWHAGWESAVPEFRSAPYFRFIGSLVLPFFMFFLVYNSVARDRQIYWGLIFITLYGWYALYVGYLQYAAIRGLTEARSLIWPAYINDPNYGIHFDRARGAFSAAGPQAVFLVLLFYVDMFLVRKLRGFYRVALIVQAMLVPPAIFFAGLRSAYLAFLLCGLIWLIVGSRWRFGASKLGLIVILIAASVFALWSNLTSTDRARGGMAQVAPLQARRLLLHQTARVLQERPVFGVGFGHWADAQMEFEEDPGSLAAVTTGALAEHNLFLTMVAETGIPGLAGVVLLFVLLFRQSHQLYRKLPSTAVGALTRDFVVLFWVALVNFLTDAMFRDTLWDIFANGMFWSLAALVVGYNRLLEPHPLDLPPAGQDIAL
jgi:O-antigen ligase